MNPPEIRPPPIRRRNCNLKVFNEPRGAYLLPALSDSAAAAIRSSAPCYERVDQYQKMVDAQNPYKAQEERERSFMGHLPYVQATSRQLQSHLEIFDDETSRLPHLSEEGQNFNNLLVKRNAQRIHSALDRCKDYAVLMTRESSKAQFLDEAMMRRMHPKLVAAKASYENATTAASQSCAPPAAAANLSSLAESMKSANARRVVAMTGLNIPLPEYYQNGNSTEIAAGSAYEAMNDEEDHSDAGGCEGEGDFPPIDELVGGIDTAECINLKEFHCHSFHEQLEVPNPQDMPGTLTEALCNWHQFWPTPIFALTLDDVTRSVANPRQKTCVLLRHFEVGLDGVEAIIKGFVQIPETTERKHQCEKRLQKLGVRNSGDVFLSGALKKAPHDKTYGKRLWRFYGVRFRQTSRERKLAKPAKWLCFGAPQEACNKLRVSIGHGSQVVMLGGGLARTGSKTDQYESRMTRRYLLMCKGGIAPIDAWEGAEDWKGGLLQRIRAAMAKNGLRVSWLDHEQGAKALKDKVMLVKEASASND